ncbi:MAG: hypothetical protein E6J85_05860 [Deltaproteobacteria bacterium]|nr:MAG: hypothetical protein E6J85_05860 [Deltaproteobacteria bacterium]
MLEGEGRARIALGICPAEGEVLGERARIAGPQRRLHGIEGDAILRIERKGAPEFGDGLVALPEKEPILRGLGAQERGAARILAAAGEPGMQSGAFLPGLGGGVVPDQLGQRGDGFEEIGRVGKQAPIELGRARISAPRPQRRRPAQRIRLLVGCLAAPGKPLECFRRIVGPAHPGEQTREWRQGRISRGGVELHGADGIFGAPFGVLGGAGMGLGSSGSFGKRLGDLDQDREGRGMISAPRLHPGEAAQHGQVGAGEGQRLRAGCYRLVIARKAFVERRPLRVKRGGARGIGAASLFGEQFDALARRKRRQREQSPARRLGTGIDRPRLAQERGRAGIVERGAGCLRGLDEELRGLRALGVRGARLEGARERSAVGRTQSQGRPRLQPARRRETSPLLRGPLGEGERARGESLRSAQDHGGAAEKLRRGPLSESRRGALEEVGHLRRAHRSAALEQPQRGRGGWAVAGQRERLARHLRGLGAPAGPLQPGSCLDEMGGRLGGGMLGERLAQRHETVRGGPGVAQSDEPRVQRDGGSVARILGKGLGEELFLLDGIAGELGGAALQIRALAGLGAHRCPYAQGFGQVEAALLPGELIAKREQRPVAPGVLERGLHFCRSLRCAAQPEGGNLGDDRAVRSRARPLRLLTVEAQDRFPVAGSVRPLEETEETFRIARIGGVQLG